jgi:hypothetical protein
MLASIEDLKDSLGIAQSDVTHDAVLNTSLRNANSIMASYIGFDASDVDAEYPYTVYVADNCCYINLPVWPVVAIVSITSDGNILATTDWLLEERLGTVHFPNGLPFGGAQRIGHRVSVVYKAGFADIPDDLNMVCLNIAAALYTLGGNFSSSTNGGTGELKTLTMFDAMSMSFDTGSSTSGVPPARRRR